MHKEFQMAFMNGMPQWTQEEAIAYECACECMTDLMGIRLAEIREEEAKLYPDAERLASLEAEFSRLNQERKRLHVDSHAEVARINDEYGAVIRAWRAERQAVFA